VAEGGLALHRAELVPRCAGERGSGAGQAHPSTPLFFSAVLNEFVLSQRETWTKMRSCLSGSAKAVSPGSFLTLCHRTPNLLLEQRTFNAKLTRMRYAGDAEAQRQEEERVSVSQA
jgi:hypothetical protein